MINNIHTDNLKLLESNRKYFESCIKVAQNLFDEKLYEDCIKYIEKIAYFAWHNFTGYYKSELLEVLLAKIHNVLLPTYQPKKKLGDSKRILHICSELWFSGGHSKLLYTWINNDKSRKHSIVSTRQETTVLEEISSSYLHDISDIEHLSVKSSSKIESIKILHQIIQENYDAILLHIHPDESITNIVLSDLTLTTPILFVNHADHTFWLGASITDILLQIRETNILLDVERRGIPMTKQFYLPIPIENIFKDEENVQISKNQDEKPIQLLSTGTEWKYNPTDQYNFLKEAKIIVEANPNVIFNVVGINANSAYAQTYAHSRIILHGDIPFSELVEIEKNIDVYVEGFPTPSFTALLQIALRKIPFALHYNPTPLFTLFNEGIENDIFYPNNLQDWHRNLNKMINDKKYRESVADNQYRYIKENFSLEVWKSRLSELYEIANKKKNKSYNTTTDHYYEGTDEKILVTMDNRVISHYNFTNKLSLKQKFFIYKISKLKNDNVSYYGSREIIKYLLS